MNARNLCIFNSDGVFGKDRRVRPTPENSVADNEHVAVVQGVNFSIQAN
jgi:hypothetical protein